MGITRTGTLGFFVGLIGLGIGLGVGFPKSAEASPIPFEAYARISPQVKLSDVPERSRLVLAGNVLIGGNEKGTKLVAKTPTGEVVCDFILGQASLFPARRTLEMGTVFEVLAGDQKHSTRLYVRAKTAGPVRRIAAQIHCSQFAAKPQAKPPQPTASEKARNPVTTFGPLSYFFWTLAPRTHEALELDSDRDGVPDYLDECPRTPAAVLNPASGQPVKNSVWREGKYVGCGTGERRLRDLSPIQPEPLFGSFSHFEEDSEFEGGYRPVP